MTRHPQHTAIAPSLSALLLAVACLHATAVAAQTAPPVQSGSTVFKNYCATCHGTSAKGDGPLASSLTKRPADLTQIAKRNGGTFPVDVIARTIDGRSPVKGHGGGDMPVWGDAFGKSAADTTPIDQKIDRLVSYLESIQVKP